MRLFEIRDPAVDVQAIQAIIAEKIEERHTEAKKQGLDFDELVRSNPLDKQMDEIITAWMLELIETRHTAILLEPYTSPPGQGKAKTLITWVKKQFHDLVIYYVNLLGKKQISVNQELAWMIAIQRDRLAQLQMKVNALEQEVERLNRKTASSGKIEALENG